MQVQLFDGWLAKYLGIWILFNCMLFQLVQGLMRSTDPICMSFQLSRTPQSASKAPTTASFCHACWELKNPAFFKGSAFYLSHGPQVFDPQPHACVSQLWPPAFFPVRVRQWLPSSIRARQMGYPVVGEEKAGEIYAVSSVGRGTIINNRIKLRDTALPNSIVRGGKILGAQ